MDECHGSVGHLTSWWELLLIYHVIEGENQTSIVETGLLLNVKYLVLPKVSLYLIITDTQGVLKL